MSLMYFWALILPVLWAVEAYGSCPLPESIHPCTCKIISDKFGVDFALLSCSNITSEDKLARIVTATSGHKLFELQLVDSSFRYIPHNIFQGTTFEVISIENSSISALSETDIAFEGLENSLHLIEVVNCSFITNWEWTQLAHLKHLMEIVVMKSELLDIANGLSTVKHVDIEAFVFTENKIQWLDRFAFAPFEFLARLTLDKNYIEHIERSMLPRPANRLKILGLSYNRLTSLPEDMFHDMPALASLYLTGNPLRTIDESVFRPIWKQISLFFFFDTSLSCDCRVSWVMKADNSRKYIHAECAAPAHVRGRPITKVQTHELWC